MRVNGDLVIVNSIDHSLKVYRLRANGNHELVSEAPGELAIRTYFRWKEFDHKFPKFETA